MRIHDIVGHTPKKRRITTIPGGEHRIPDRVQRDFTPERVAFLLEEYLDSHDRVREVRLGLDEVRKRLGGPGAYDRAAEAVLGEIGIPRVI